MFRIALLCLLAATGLFAQKFGVGKAASPDEIAALDIAVSPDGKGLPPGQGTAAEGAKVYETQCRECHGPEGKGGDETGFIGTPADLKGDKPKKTVGSYWPYATTLWDYINRAMPFVRPGTLTDDQVYSVTAYILHLNGIVGENDTLNAETLPKVEMPNRNGFVPDPRPDVK
ncbi:MAG: c-type cytochrome [Acidobacteria bacterium]|nr:c-type cytochrome [Acidobacteriota bacterium]